MEGQQQFETDNRENQEYILLDPKASVGLHLNLQCEGVICQDILRKSKVMGYYYDNK